MIRRSEDSGASVRPRGDQEGMLSKSRSVHVTVPETMSGHESMVGVPAPCPVRKLTRSSAGSRAR